MTKKGKKKGNEIKSHKQIIKQREKVHKIIKTVKHITSESENRFVKTGIQGFDKLLNKGIPKNSSTLICGGPGSGKTIMGLQILYNAAKKGQKCLYMSFEESEKKLIQHMKDFGWEPDKLIKSKKLLIKRYDLFRLRRSMQALIKKAQGSLMIDISPILFDDDFKPDWIVVDSLSGISSGFYGVEESYRVYIESLFKLLEQMGATSFLITESTQIPTKITQSGVEEFLADGVVLLYNVKSGQVREKAIEILKLRGASFKEKTVAMKIVSGKGIVVYPEQEAFGTE